MLPTLQQCQKNILKSKAFLDYFPQLPKLCEQKMLSVYLMKLTKKNRYGFVGIIKDIVIHSKDDKMSHDLIGHIAEYAIEHGCYGCTIDELVE